MKRFTSMLMALVMLFNMAPAAYAAEVEVDNETVPTEINADTVWSYLDNGTDPAGDASKEGYERTSWTAVEYDDGQWETGKGSFGAKEGQIASLGNGCTPNTLLTQYKEDGSTNIEAFFFRTDVRVEDPSAVEAIEGRLIHDDSATLYINGTRVAGWGDDKVTENLQYASEPGHQDAPATEIILITDEEVLELLTEGVNTIAVEIHQDRVGSSDVYFDMPSLTFQDENEPPLERPDDATEINEDTVWSYLDDGTDPAGDASKEGYKRTSWTAVDFDDSAWKTSKGSLGAKQGAIGSVDGYMPDYLLNQYKEDGSNVEAFFFRTTVMIEDAADVKQILGTVIYDDSATVYINGTKIAGFDDGEITANLQYGGHNSSTLEGAINITDAETLAVLKNGVNVVAVEVHQGRAASSDIYFGMPSLEFLEEMYAAPAEAVQSNISLSMGADQTQMNVTWHSTADTAGSLLVAKASELVDGAMPEEAEVFEATSVANNDGKYTNKATASGLKAGVRYAYQAVNGDAASEIGFFTPDNGGAFSFAYVGDPQIGSSGNVTNDTSGWGKTLREVAENEIFSDISFMLSAGDQVDSASSESQYDGYLDHAALKDLPAATVIGNHDSSSDAYSQHFNVPNESDAYGTTTAGGDYWFVYNNALFMVLNTNDLSEAEHRAFMKDAIDANPDVDWKIVTFHQSIYTVAGHYDNDGTDRRETLVPVFDELDIDVVLQGHDHVYCRTYMMKNFAVSDTDKYTYGNGGSAAPTAVTDPEGILYVTANSGSGSKHYGIKTDKEFFYSAVQNQEWVPNVSKVSVSDTQFTITTYRTTDMTVVDTFTINRTNEENPGENPGETPEVPSAATEINKDTVWSYLDDGTDPAGDASVEGYERTSWTAVDYDDSAWKTGKGSFGAKRGNLAPVNGYIPNTLLTQYKQDGSTNIEAFFFRTEIMIEDASEIKQILGKALGDDSVTLYINGTKVAGFHDEDITANVQYGGDDAVEETLDFTDAQTLSLLRDGKNVVAAEVHQCDEGSSDIYFDVPSLEFRNEVYVEPVALSNVSLSMGADQTKMNVTWHINADTAGKLLVAKASELVDGAMPENAKTFEATSERNNDSKYTNKATASGLEAGVKYAYQAVNGEAASEIGFFTPDDGGAFSFAYVGDPQIGSSGSTDSDTSGWDNTLNLVATDNIFSGISFMLSAGDQVDSANSESQYDGYLDHAVLKNLPVATVIGNHDSYSDSYSQHFNVANESDAYGTTDAGGDYWFVYNNALFMVLNTNDLSEAEHRAFMKDAIDANPDVDWKIVTFHQSIYTVAGHYDNDGTDRRETLVPVFDELDIDVVLQGHDHVYCRTYMMKNFAVSDTDKYTYGNGDSAAPTAVTDPEGVLYVTANSGSGSKHYDIVQNVAFPYSAVQNQEHVPNVSKVSISDTQFTITTYRTHDMTVVDTFTINRTADQDVVDINTISDTGLVEYLSSYSTGCTNKEGGVAEIVKFNEENDCMYLVSGQTQTLDIVKVNADGRTTLVKKVDIAALGATNGFSAGDITSVDVNTDRDLVAIAVQNADYTENGVIVTLDYEGNFVAKYEAGVQPDMVTFSPNGNYILSANEGEPREGYEATDPMGAVSVVDLTTGNATTYTFESLDSSRETLIANGVLLKTGTAPSVDLEPEFIAVSSDSKTAYVTLQENNAVAALDLTSGTWKYVKGLGFKDHSADGNGLDLDQDDKIDIRSENVYGVYMPDGISVVTINGQDYLITANEGDAREWGGYKNIDSDKLVLSDGEKAGKKIEYLDTAKTDGLESGKTYILGGRSFSIWNADTLEQVFDSGDDFEVITAAEFPAYFNSGHDEAGLDKRSHKKGVEPESVSVLETNGKIYAIVGLERMGGIMVYNISDPGKAVYADYLNVRGFSETVTDLDRLGDLGPEGICTISAEDSPTGNAMILVANEISGTVTVAQIKKVVIDDGDNDDGGHDHDDNSGSSGNGTSSGPSKPASGTSKDDEVEIDFVDVKDSAYYAKAVRWAVENGITSGTSATTFSPDQVCTRAQIVTFLWRAAGSPEPISGQTPFEDVRADAYYCKAVRWAVENGITSGTSATTFAPDLVCTRAQIATFLWRAQDSVKIKNAEMVFSDVSASAYYYNAVLWAVENGITNGTSATTFSPDQACTRAQCVTFLWKALAD